MLLAGILLAVGGVLYAWDVEWIRRIFRKGNK